MSDCKLQLGLTYKFYIILNEAFKWKAASLQKKLYIFTSFCIYTLLCTSNLNVYNLKNK